MKNTKILNYPVGSQQTISYGQIQNTNVQIPMYKNKLRNNITIEFIFIVVDNIILSKNIDYIF